MEPSTQDTNTRTLKKKKVDRRVKAGLEATLVRMGQRKRTKLIELSRSN